MKDGGDYSFRFHCCFTERGKYPCIEAEPDTTFGTYELAQEALFGCMKDFKDNQMDYVQREIDEIRRKVVKIRPGGH